MIIIEYPWRITKYNPMYRNEKGHYVNDEWTSMFDIGKVYPTGLFTMQQYLDIENLYVTAVIEFLDYLEIQYLEVNGLEKWSEEIEILDFHELYSSELIDLYSQVKNGDKLNKKDVGNLCRLVLRNNLWCRLTYRSEMYIHFGHDYYMFIGSLQKCVPVIDKIVNTGLFVEPYESPINDKDEEEIN